MKQSGHRRSAVLVASLANVPAFTVLIVLLAINAQAETYDDGSNASSLLQLPVMALTAALLLAVLSALAGWSYRWLIVVDVIGALLALGAGAYLAVSYWYDEEVLRRAAAVLAAAMSLLVAIAVLGRLAIRERSIELR